MLKTKTCLLAAVALQACSLVPQTEPPQPIMPLQWRHMTAQPDSVVSAEWWTAFGSEELARLEDEALRYNRDFRAAAERVVQAQATIRSARSTLFPVVGTTGGAARSGTLERGIDDRNSFDASLSASYEVDLWGANRAGILSARAGAAATAFDRETIGLTLTADVAITYLQYLTVEDRLGVARDNIANARQVLELAETRLRLGATSPLEVAQQRSTLASVNANLASLTQQRAQTLNALAILVGTQPQHFIAAAGSLDDVKLPLVTPGLPSTLLARRPDIRRVEASLVAANADIGIARAAFYPNIDLTARGGVASASLSTILDAPSTLYSIAAGIAAPIFQGGRLTAELERARSRYRELLETYGSTILAALGDVEDNLAAAKYLADVEAAQQEALTQARRAYDIAATQYREGAVDFLTVLDTQRSLFQARDSVVQARSARLQTAVGLYRALGGGWSVAAVDAGAS